jgi:hypothetical protein
MLGSLTGTWSHVTGSAKTYTSTGTITMVLRRETATHPTHNCHAVTTGTCTITVSSVSVTGIITSATIPTLAISDTATVNGGTVAGSTLVSGTASNCGLFIGANNGFATINAHVHVTAV